MLSVNSFWTDSHWGPRIRFYQKWEEWRHFSPYFYILLKRYPKNPSPTENFSDSESARQGGSFDLFNFFLKLGQINADFGDSSLMINHYYD